MWLFLLFSQLTMAQTLKGYKAEVYGFLKLSQLYSSQELASFQNLNLSAPTHAPYSSTQQQNSSRWSMQTQQSRIGVKLNKNKTTLTIESDFVDFNKSSPTTQMNPRMRILSLDYKISDTERIIAGQTWDLFSPLMPQTFDLIGSYFMSGNAGFMRPQLQYLKTKNEWEYGVALGLPSPNSAPADTTLETNKSPSYALRLTHNTTQGKWGLSGIFAKVSVSQTLDKQTEAYAFNSFFENNLSESLSLKSEVYYGQNTANLGLLTLSKASDSNLHQKEFGGYLNLIYKQNEELRYFGGVGTARITTPSELSPLILNSQNVITNQGVLRNILSRIGVSYKIDPDIEWVSEISQFQTKTLTSNNIKKDRNVSTVETGFLVNF